MLVAEGFAGYRTNPEDKQAGLLELTETGRTALSEIQARQQVWTDALGAEIGRTDLAQALLSRIAEAVVKVS